MVTALKRVLFVMAILAPLQSGVIMALSGDQQQLFNEGINYFDSATASVGLCTATPSLSLSTGSNNASASNLDYAGRAILSPDQLKEVATNQAVYQQAAQQVGIPWQMLAALHYREHGFSTTQPDSEPATSLSGNAIGVYQITDNQNNQQFITRSAYPPQPGMQLTQAQFLQQSIDAANFLKAIEHSLSANPDDSIVKDAFVKYNGEPQLYKDQATARGFDGNSQGYEGSPYVTNEADAKRDNGSGQAGSWLQSLGPKPGQVAPAAYGPGAYGAFLVYADLSGGLQSGGCAAASCSGATPNNTSVLSTTRQNIVCVATQQWQLWQNGQLNPGTGYLTYSQNRNEDWCADFASWVYNQASDPLNSSGWNIDLVKNIQTVGEQNQNFHWHPIGSSYTPQPGDLAIHGEAHVNIVVGVSGTQVTLIGGNQNGGQGANSFIRSSVTEYPTNPTSDDPPITGYVSPD